MTLPIYGNDLLDEARARPCSKCRSTPGCFLLHDYLPSDCPLPTCDICPTIAKIDEEISNAQNLLFNLAKKRQDAKRQINSRHDRLFGRLPVEVVSRIFRFVAKSYTTITVYTTPEKQYKWRSAAVLLGTVCRGWRASTLETPHLWTAISISLRMSSSKVDVVKDLLHRSRLLPLSVSFFGGPSRDKGGLKGLWPLLKVVRSHSARWRHFTSDIPSSELHALFHRLKDVPKIRSLFIDLFDTGPSSKMKAASLSAPLCPRNYHAVNFSSEKMSFEWHNLTRLHVIEITIDELAQIIICASKLTECTVKLLEASEGRFPLPTIPVCHKSLKVLEAHHSSHSEAFLGYFTFPSLQDLDYSLEANEDAILIFSDFLMCSAAPLSSFTLRYSISDLNDIVPWAQALSAVTCLELDIRESGFKLLSVSDMTESTFQVLTHPQCPLLNLQSLQVFTPIMTSRSWNSLADFLQNSHSEDTDVRDALDSAIASNQSEGQGHLQLSESDYIRPLREVEIRQTGNMDADEAPEIEMATLAKFKRIARSGISLNFIGYCLDINLLDYAAKYYFGDFDDSSNSGTSRSLDTDESNKSGNNGFGDNEDSDGSEYLNSDDFDE